MLRYYLSLVFLVLVSSQGLRPFGVQPNTAVAGTWALVQKIADQSGRANLLTCVTVTCTLTVPSTGSGHGLLLGSMSSNGSGITISSVSGGCASWQVDAGAHKSSGAIVDINAAYCLSSTASATSIVVTLSSAPTTDVIIYYEVSWSGSSISHDTSGATQNAASSTPAGQGLTLGGSGNEAILQFIGTASGGPTAITSPYDTNLLTKDNASSTLSFTGGSVAFTSSGSAPTWTLSGSSASLVSAVALKGN